ncbi:MAG: fumarylacetoacetase [Alphaproteobacteria bacterium]|nr:fumarylacetoacetase [Alphaproteobacteria bacterium]
MVLDLAALRDTGVLPGEAARAAEAANGSALNALFALGAGPRRALRGRLSSLLTAGSPDCPRVEACLHPASRCTMHLPVRIGDYTDFYAGVHHATNVGKAFRPDNPLLPNYKYVPIGYHGRASSVVPSGTLIRRPNGQRKRATDAEPSFGPSRNLDYELELGIWIGPGNTLGDPIPISEAANHVAGFCLLNDWSARDIQAWEYQPLGPFLAKSFATTISPWVITPEALAPFRVAQPPRPVGDPPPLAYLLDETDQREGALDVELEVLLLAPGQGGRGLPPHRLALSGTRHLYWTVAQLVTSHASNGCNLQPGDLLGSGTISAPGEGGFGSLLEATHGGKQPVQLACGQERRFLEDGDEVLLRARARHNGFADIGFGECRGLIQPGRTVADQ